MPAKTLEQPVAELEKRAGQIEIDVASFAARTIFMVGALCHAAPEMRVPMLERLQARLKWQPKPGVVSLVVLAVKYALDHLKRLRGS